MNGIKNSIMLIGNLGKDPETKTLEGGKALTRFSMATSEVYRNAGGDKVTSTQWHNIVAFGKIAELTGNLLKKGKEVVVRGKLTYRSYKDKEGVERSIPEVVIDEFALLSKEQNSN